MPIKQFDGDAFAKLAARTLRLLDDSTIPPDRAHRELTLIGVKAARAYVQRAERGPQGF